MRIAVVNFSGNVGKTTVARHLLLPRIPRAELIAVESINAGGGANLSLRGTQFADLYRYMKLRESAVVDIGASNLEDFLDMMEVYQGSHKDFDFYIVPTLPTPKQQEDTIATLIDLARLGVEPSRVKLVFNMSSARLPIETSFSLVLSFLAQHPIATATTAAHIRASEVFIRIRGTSCELTALAKDETDYNRLIVESRDMNEKLALADTLANCRLATWAVPELDACFAALGLPQALEREAAAREAA